MFLSKEVLRQFHRQLRCKFHFQRQRSSSNRPYFITTPIFYVNGAPHIGHLQSCMYADAFSRMQRLLGRDVLFSVGTDEHGMKIQQAAKLSAKDTLMYCTEISTKFKELFMKSDVSFTDFVRTTESRHRIAVHNFWNILKDNNYLYKSPYEGWYDVIEETFVPPSQIKEVEEPTGKKVICSESGHTLVKTEEENYLFKLSKFENDLLYWLSKDVVKPMIYAEELKRWVSKGLEDLSVSRNRDRLPWGIPVPHDDTQTIYVWLDALVNYLTLSGFPNKDFVWPPSCQVIGKDISKFHCLYWPAFLMAAGLEPPQEIFCHAHWLVNHEKMSKSKGNVVDPLVLMEKYGSEGLRYFLLRASLPETDSNFSEIKIHRLLNAELADTLGNLLSRCCAPSVNVRQVFPAFSAQAFTKIQNEAVLELIKNVQSLKGETIQYFTEGDFYHGIENIMDNVRKTNAFIQSERPWELARMPSEQDRLDTVLYIALEVLRVSGLLLQPIIPTLSAQLLDKLGMGQADRLWVNIQAFQALDNEMTSSRELGQDNSILYVRRRG